MDWVVWLLMLNLETTKTSFERKPTSTTKPPQQLILTTQRSYKPLFQPTRVSAMSLLLPTTVGFRFHVVLL